MTIEVVAPGAVGTGLLGRDRERERLESFLDAAATAAHGLLLKGEPGIGKTSLWRLGIERARERGFRVLTARPAEPEASLSFAALGDLLTDTPDTIGALPEPQRRALRVALLLEEESGAAIDSRTLAVALLGLLRRLAEETPVLIAIDDVQWLDPPTAAALQFASRRLESERVSVLGTARPEPIPLTTEAILVVSIGPLNESAIETLVRRVLEIPPARAVIRRLGDASGGNPFYAVELARAFLEEQPYLQPTDPLPVPADLSDLLRRRLSALPPASVRALSAAAALAQPTRDLVAGAVGDDVEGLEDALAAGIVEAADGVIRFTHPLLAAAVYRDTDPRARRELHRRLAGVVGDLEERARHLALAVEPPDAEVAATLEEAAARGFARGATESAAELTELALRFTPAPLADALHRRRLAGTGYLARTGAKARARELLDEASLAASPGAERARIAVTATWFGIWDRASCIAALRNAVEDARDEPLLLLQVHGLLGGILHGAPDVVGAQHHSAIALELAEQIGDDADLALAWVGVANAALLSGRGIELELAQRAADLEADAGNPYGNVGVAQSFLGFLLALRGDLDVARSIFEAKIAEERRRGDIGVGGTLCQLAWLEIQAGKWPRAQRAAEESLELAREVGDVVTEVYAQRWLTKLAVLRGEAERARELASEGLRLADVAQAPVAGAQILSDLGLLELSLDEAEAAAAYFGDVARFVADAGLGGPLLSSFVPEHVEALIAMDDLDHAEAVLRAFESQASRLDLEVELAHAQRCRGGLAAARGELDAAVVTLAEARAAAAELGQPFELGRALLAEGTVLRRARRIAEARAALTRSLSLFDELGAALWAQRARRELARLGGRPGQTGELTPTEQQIAELVAGGRSNPEVARMLHVSPKTVEWNLSKVYRKLGVASRTELAAKLVHPAD
jgi:DNA-binding CsgD family transcriptional regulator